MSDKINLPALIAAASPLPWRVEVANARSQPDYCGVVISDAASPASSIAVAYSYSPAVHPGRGPANARLIAAAVNAGPGLVARVAELEALLPCGHPAACTVDIAGVPMCGWCVEKARGDALCAEVERLRGLLGRVRERLAEQRGRWLMQHAPPVDMVTPPINPTQDTIAAVIADIDAALGKEGK